jgi:G3E family GTPase
MILVGGFLGAGKTTLLARAAEELAARGRRVGLITNDQAANLVDTEVLRQAGQEVKEVSGACFCCAFNKLLYVCENLIDLHHPDVILAEPVGSCTDLSATVLQPLKKLCADRFDLAPYTVLVDPDKLVESLEDGQADDIAAAVRYIYRKQIEEADLVVVNKIDRLAAGRRAEILSAIGQIRPGTPVFLMSALERTGVREWLDHILSGGAAGQRIVEVDYDTYAAGEAALGWLNAAVELSAGKPTDWKALALRFLKNLQTGLERQAGEVAHLKLFLAAPAGRLQVNVTSSAGEPLVQGDLAAASTHATLVINARVRISPEQLRAAVEASLAQAAGPTVTVNVAEISSFRPGRPQPVHRYGQIV